MIKNIIELKNKFLDLNTLDRIMEKLGYLGEMDWFNDDELKDILDEGHIAYSKDHGFTHDVLYFKVLIEASNDESIKATVIEIIDIQKYDWECEV